MSTEDHLLTYFTSLYQGPMSRVDAYSADFGQRIASVARFLVREAHKFYSRLSAEGRASYDLEDIILELWIALKERDAKYDSGKGTYLHFAQAVTRTCLYSLNERCRIVKHAPGISLRSAETTSRMEAFDPDDIAYLESILRPSRDHGFIPNGTPDERARAAIDQDIQNEEYHKATQSVIDFLDTLNLFECIALGAAVGLWGDDPENVVKLKAQQYNTSSYALGRALMTARIKLRSYVEEMRNLNHLGE